MKTTLNLRLVLLCKMMLIIFMAKMNAKDQDTFALKNRDTTLCVGVSLKLEVTLNDSTDAKSWKNYRIEWTHNKTTLLSETNSYTLKNVSPKDAGGYYFEVKALNSDTVIFKGSIKVTVHDLPVFPSLEHTIRGNDLNLLCITNNNNLKVKWTSPANTEHEGIIVMLKEPTIKEIGLYNIDITDTTTGCTNKSTYNVSLESEPDKKKADNIVAIQEGLDQPKSFLRTFKAKTTIKECNIRGQEISISPVLSPLNARFYEIADLGDSYLIYFQIWKKKNIAINKYPPTWAPKNRKAKKYIRIDKDIVLDTNALRYQFNFTNPTETQARYFLLSKKDYAEKTVPYYFTWRKSISATAGTVLIPVKSRYDSNFEFTPEVSLGVFVGAKCRVSHYQPHYLNLGITSGISFAILSPLNSTVDTISNVAAFTTSLGLVYEFDQAEIGLFLGWDYINGNNNRDGSARINWTYQGRPWFSIGLGYSILNRPKVVASKEKGQ